MVAPLWAASTPSAVSWLKHSLAGIVGSWQCNKREAHTPAPFRELALMPATLRDAWLSGDQGKLSPLETLKAWALKQVYLEEGYSEKGVYVKIASRVHKVGGGSPGPDAVRKLLLKIDADSEWYPGKKMGQKPGRKRALSPLARAAIKRSAEAMKANDLEPTYPLVVARCPEAVRNPETGEPVDKKAVYEIFRTSCFDEGSQVPWDHCPRAQKTALSEDVMRKRKSWALHMRDEAGHSGSWYYQHVMWTDICHSLLPRTAAKAKEQALARKGKKAWMSKDKKLYVRNLKGKARALKQNSWGVERIWWFPVLTRGKLHVELLPETFPGEKPRGIHELVSKLPGILNARFPTTEPPKVVMTDRGPAFYHTATGRITREYKASLRAHGLRPLMGDNASKQSGDAQEVMLHETAVALLRRRLTLTVPRKPWLETREAYGARLKDQAAFINVRYNLEGLSKEFPLRLQKVIDHDGGRIWK